MKKIGNVFKFIFEVTRKGFFSICLVFSRGFYFYLYIFVSLLRKIFRKSEKLAELEVYYKNRQESPEYFLLLLFGCVLLISTVYVFFFDTNEVVKLDENIEEEIVQRIEEANSDTPSPVEEKLETNLYKIYGNMNFDQINFDNLRTTNSDTVMWISVDGTNVNYPIVQTTDNDYYLNHNFNKKKTSTGWPFLDYRNSKELTDANTIFYGHNLLNKTAFGSVANLFTKEWFNSSNHKIIVLTGDMIYTYEVFSVYYSTPEVYYLQVNFSNDSHYAEFINTISGKSIWNFNTPVSTEDKIITLSTCTDDNKNRRVVHAKLVSVLSV